MRIIFTRFIDRGGIHASRVLYQRKDKPQFCYSIVPDCVQGLLESVLFANIRFHDTVSRGRLLNRFGKDFEGKLRYPLEGLSGADVPPTGVDSSLPDNFGRSVMYGLSAATTFISITIIGGLPFLFVAIILGWLYYSGKDLRTTLAYNLLIPLHSYSWESE